MEWLLLVLLVVAAFGYGWYVALISRRNRVREALASIDVHLQKRFDLLPNLLKLAQKFMTHEAALLGRLAELRSELVQGYRRDDPAAVARHLEAAKELDAGLGRLFAVAEAYPELRSSETVTEAQRSFTEVESQIAAARRFYNAAVTALNTAVEVFPGSIIARWAGVEPWPFWEVETPEARKAIDVDDYLK